MAGTKTPGRHAAALPRRQSGRAPGALTSALRAGSRHVLAVIRRIPPRPPLWAGVCGSWAIALVLPGTGLWSALKAGTLSTGCLAAIAWLNRREQRQWRETRGRMDGQPHTWQAATDINAGRIEDLEARMHEIEAAHAAYTMALTAAFGHAGIKPPATRGNLTAVPDGRVRGA